MVANLDVRAQRLRLWIDGEMKAEAKTHVCPLATLLWDRRPGIGVGNVQNPEGVHNQPFDGMVCDLRLYRVALNPQQVGAFTVKSIPPLPEDRGLRRVAPKIHAPLAFARR